MKLQEGWVSAWTIDLKNWKQIPDIIKEKHPGHMIVGKPHSIKVKPLRKPIERPVATEPERVRPVNKDLFLTTIDTKNILIWAIDSKTMKILDLHRRREIIQSNASLLSEPIKVPPNYSRPWDQRLQTPTYQGDEGLEQFYRKFKLINKEREWDDDRFGYSASTGYLSMCEELKLSPRLNGLVWFEKDNEMDVIAWNNHMGS